MKICRHLLGDAYIINWLIKTLLNLIEFHFGLEIARFNKNISASGFQAEYHLNASKLSRGQYQ